MRRALIVGVVTLAATVGATGSAGGGTYGAPQSGIRGHVTIGPTTNCAAVQQGRKCSGPYAARLRIRRACDKAVIRRVRADKRGRFRVSISPGRYIVDPVNGHPYPRAPRRLVTVKRGVYTFVRIGYDSGIR